MFDFINKNIKKILIGLLAIPSIAAFITLVFYFYNLKSDKFSPDPEAWAWFGDYVGGVLNAIFGFSGLLAVLLTLIVSYASLSKSEEAVEAARDAINETKNAHRIDSTTALMEYYFSDQMLKVRRKADEWLVQASDDEIDDMLLWMKAPKERPDGWKAKPEHDSVWTLIEFFQMASILIENKTVNEEMVKIILVRYKSWDNSVGLGRVFERGKDLLESDLKFLDTLRKLTNSDRNILSERQ